MMSLSFILAIVALILVVIHIVNGKIPWWIPMLFLILIHLLGPFVR
jgi:hypothetical protein